MEIVIPTPTQNTIDARFDTTTTTKIDSIIKEVPANIPTILLNVLFSY